MKKAMITSAATVLIMFTGVSSALSNDFVYATGIGKTYADVARQARMSLESKGNKYCRRMGYSYGRIFDVNVTSQQGCNHGLGNNLCEGKVAAAVECIK